MDFGMKELVSKTSSTARTSLGPMRTAWLTLAACTCPCAEALVIGSLRAPLVAPMAVRSVSMRMPWEPEPEPEAAAAAPDAVEKKKGITFEGLSQLITMGAGAPMYVCWVPTATRGSRDAPLAVCLRFVGLTVCGLHWSESRADRSCLRRALRLGDLKKVNLNKPEAEGGAALQFELEANNFEDENGNVKSGKYRDEGWVDEDAPDPMEALKKMWPFGGGK